LDQGIVNINSLKRVMKKINLSIFLILIFFSAQSQDIIRKDTGTVNGAHYKILFPKDWKKKLVMFAHGYEFIGSPSAINSPQMDQLAKIFLDRGFAVAASAYEYQGFALPQGVDDTEALRQYFWHRYGVPDSTFIAGQSMGGGVVLAIMENFSKNYQGALAMCPLSSRPYLQTRKEFELHVLFDALFPGVITPLTQIMDIHTDLKQTGVTEIGSKIEIIRKAVAGDSVKAAELDRQFCLKTSDIPFSLLFGEAVLRDVALKSGGNPYDNTNTIYTGFSDDWEINKIVERFKATASPDNIFEKYDRTGDIGKPVVLMHTIYDQLIPPQYGEVNFENMVHQKGKDHFLTVKICNGQGHCNFTSDQIGKSFDELRHWVKTGEKAKSGLLE
jgi:pimeloyl-ACP methyl ester carboxylesterase